MSFDKHYPCGGERIPGTEHVCSNDACLESVALRKAMNKKELVHCAGCGGIVMTGEIHACGPPKAIRVITGDKWDRKTDFNCGSCMYFVPKVNSTAGRCRRHAPTLQGYPAVDQERDWCGDHKVGTNPLKG